MVLKSQEIMTTDLKNAKAMIQKIENGISQFQVVIDKKIYFANENEQYSRKSISYSRKNSIQIGNL